MQRNKRKIIHIVFMAMAVNLLTIPVLAKEKITIAVINFNSRGVPVSLAQVVTVLVESELVKNDNFIVLERSRMEEIFKEIGLQQTGCTDVSCAVKIGKILSAKKILSGMVIKIGKKSFISGKIIDVEKAVIEYAAKEDLFSMEELDITVKKFVDSLTGRVKAGTTLMDLGWKCVDGDCINGQGTAVHPSGKKYEGSFRHGNMNGYGILFFQNKNRYEGQFKDNRYNGQGIFFYADGRKYTGQFKDNKFHGTGALYDSSGKLVYKGHFENDKRLGCCFVFWRLQ